MGKICCEILPLLASSLHPPTGYHNIRKEKEKWGGGEDYFFHFQDKNLCSQILCSPSIRTQMLLTPASCCSSSSASRLPSYHQVKKGLLLWKLCV